VFYSTRGQSAVVPAIAPLSAVAGFADTPRRISYNLARATQRDRSNVFCDHVPNLTGIALGLPEPARAVCWAAAGRKADLRARSVVGRASSCATGVS